MKVLSTQKNSKNCIICGMENPLGLKAAFYNLDDNSVGSLFTFRSEHQSYPERTHGGMISALLDELMGRALWIDEPEMFGVTTSMNITFRRRVPFNERLKGRGYITFKGSNGFTAVGQIYDMNNKLLAEGQAKYLRLSPAIAFGNDFHADDEMCYEMPLDVLEIDFPPKK